MCCTFRSLIYCTRREIISGIKWHISSSSRKKSSSPSNCCNGFASPGNRPIMIRCIDSVQRGRKKKIIHGKHSQISILKIDLQSNQSTKDEKTKQETKCERKHVERKKNKTTSTLFSLVTVLLFLLSTVPLIMYLY